MTLVLELASLQQSQEKCLKAFAERGLTRKSACQNMLHNEEFLKIVKLYVNARNPSIKSSCADFFLQLVPKGLLSARALITVLQQHLPKADASKSLQIPALKNLAYIIVRISNFEVLLQCCSGETRVIPFVLEECKSDEFGIFFKEFLLGDPNKLLFGSITKSSYYKSARMLLLSQLACACSDESCELLLMFLIWNGFQMQVDELGLLRPIISWSNVENYANLLAAFIECLADAYFHFNLFESDLIEAAEKLTGIACDSEVFVKLACMPLLKAECSRKVFEIILKLVAPLSKSNALIGSRFDDDCLMDLVKRALSERHDELMNLPDFHSITVFGWKCEKLLKRYAEMQNEPAFFGNILETDNVELKLKGALYWSESRIEVVEKMLEIFTKCLENRDLYGFALGWLIDFMENYLSESEFLAVLPMVCKSVTPGDNILFAFVQSKLVALNAADSLAQLVLMVSLTNLLPSSESRQSRITFITSSCLSFVANICSGSLKSLDSRAVLLASKLLVKLTFLQAVDPRTIWTKYIEGGLVHCAVMKPFIADFIKAFRAVAMKDNIEDPRKIAALQWLLACLEETNNATLLGLIAETLVFFDVALIRQVIFSNIACPEGEEEVDWNRILENSTLFNPEALFAKFEPIVKKQSFKKLVADLIDGEIDNMPRPLFLGSAAESSTICSQLPKTFASNPAFYNELVFERANNVSATNFDDFCKLVKTAMIPKVPVIGSLAWFVRPHLREALLHFVSKFLDKIDDQQLLKQLTNTRSILESIKGPSTPQYAATSLLIINTLQRILFDKQILSEANLGFWIDSLCKVFTDSDVGFISFAQNDDFCAAWSVCCSMFSGISKTISSQLIEALSFIEQAKNKDSLQYLTLIDSLALLGPTCLIEKKQLFGSGKRALTFALACIRADIKCDAAFADDDYSVFAKALLTRKFDKLPAKDPSDFKGLLNYCKSLVDGEAVTKSFAENALSSKPLPAMLKFDAVLAYLCGKGLDLVRLEFKNPDPSLIDNLYKSTSDPKTRALLDFIRTVSAEKGIAPSQELSGSAERFKKKAILFYHVCCLDAKQTYAILEHCKLLPRVQWNDIPDECSGFVIKHTLSITPVTKSIYCNSSLLETFKQLLLKMAINDYKPILEILLTQLTKSETKHYLEQLFATAKDKKKLILALTDFSALIPSLSEAIMNDLVEVDVSTALNLIRNSPALGGYFLASKLSFSARFKWLKEQSDMAKYKAFATYLRGLDSKEKLLAFADALDCFYLYPNDHDLLYNLVMQMVVDHENLHILITSCDLEMEARIRSRIEKLPDALGTALDSIFEHIDYEREGY